MSTPHATPLFRVPLVLGVTVPIAVPPVDGQVPVQVSRDELRLLLPNRLPGTAIAVVDSARSDSIADTAATVRLTTTQYLAAVTAREATVDEAR